MSNTEVITTKIYFEIDKDTNTISKSTFPLPELAEYKPIKHFWWQNGIKEKLGNIL